MSKKRKSKGCIPVIFSFILSLVLVVLIFTGGFFTARGYMMYREAVKETPMDVLAENIKSEEGYVTYDEIPELYVKAVVSVEDKNFWDHSGINIRAIIRAFVNDLKAGSFVEGGSSITQQLMKNEYFSQDKEIERKIAEIFAATGFEKQYSKEEIFEFYANTIYFGSGYYGIRDAAAGYYGKAPSELSAYECIMLAGIPNAPSVYSPDVNPELAKERMNQVLDEMESDGVISEEEAAALRNY